MVGKAKFSQAARELAAALTGRHILYAFDLTGDIEIIGQYNNANGQVYAYEVSQDNYGFKTTRILPVEYVEIVKDVQPPE